MVSVIHQAKAFYDDLSSYLMEYGYVRSADDRCLFHKRLAERRQIIFCIHVDDFAVAATDDTLIDQLCSDLKHKYIVKESDTLEDFLGVHMEAADGRLHLSQPGLIKKLIATAGLDDDDISVYIPLRTDWSDEYQDAASLCTPTDNYRILLGMAMFLLLTRPDILATRCSGATILATRCAGATMRDLDSMLDLVRYLKRTRHLELIYQTGSHKQGEAIGRLYGWADAAYACHRNGHSHSGICFAYATPDTVHNTGKFSTTSKKQSVVCLSSTEAELYAAVEATKDIVFLRAILEELGYPQLIPTTLYVDNLSMITLASKFSGNAKRVKHFLFRINYMIEHVANEVVHLEYIHTLEHPADACTKSLPRPAFEKLRTMLLGKA